MSYITNMSPEQRTEALAKARLAREAASAQRTLNESTLKMNYLDNSHWASLATKYKIRMPYSNDKASPAIIRKYLKKAGLSVDTWNDSYTSMKYFCENNPLWSAYAVAGLVLELKDDNVL